MPVPETQGTPVRSLGQEDPLVEEMATHSSILVWEMPWTEEPGRLHSVRVIKESDMTKHNRTAAHQALLSMGFPR